MTDISDRPTAKMCHRRLSQEIKPVAVKALEHEYNQLKTDPRVVIDVATALALSMIATAVDCGLSDDSDDDDRNRDMLREIHAQLIIDINAMMRDFVEHRN